jgi:hypothetical protein
MTPKKRPQKIVVFQQHGSGEGKIKGITKQGGDLFELKVVSIDDALPPVIDDTSPYLPADIDADLVLDFLKHRDLSYDLAKMCAEKGIPVIASGKRWQMKGVHTPPT